VLAPRALGNCAPSAPMAGASVRPLNFTVRCRMRSALVLLSAAVALSAGTTSESQTCGTNRSRPTDSVREVRLSRVFQEPSFYYRAQDYVIFLPQNDVRHYFTEALSSTDPTLGRLAREILADIPAAQSQDLFRYNLHDWIYWSYINTAVVQLVTDGHAAISNMGGVQIDHVTIVHSEGPGYSGTEVHVGNRKTTAILRRVECIT